MKNIKRITVGLLLVLLASFAFGACNTAKYTVTFESNGGDAVEPIVVSSGKTVRKPDDPAKDGFAFGAWYYNPELTRIAVFPLTLTADYTLYAKWLPVYAIAYRDAGDQDFSGVKGGGTPSSHTFGTKTNLVDPSKEGYRFDGWFLAPDCGGAALTSLAAETFSADITLYAKWSVVYTIRYRDQGDAEFSGTHGAGYRSVHAVGTETTLVSPTKPGYDFMGWFEDAGCAGTALTSLAADAYDANITLYAKWTPKTFTVTFNANGGADAPANATVSYGAAMPALSDKPGRAGYKFLGFFDAATGGKQYYDEYLTGADRYNYTADITLYAQWTAVTLISSAAEFRSFATQVNTGTNYAGVYLLLSADIDLNGAEWTPIGLDSTRKFAGTFDGDGHTVGNFTVTAGSQYQRYAGLFGYNSGTIKNLGAVDFIIDILTPETTMAAGGMVGYNYEGTLINCYATGDVAVATTAMTVNASAYAGGLVGNSYGGGSIVGCYATGDVYVGVLNTVTDVPRAYGGGLIGNSTSKTVSGSYATGDVLAHCDVQAYAGGLVGSSGEGTFTNCYATGDVLTTTRTYYAFTGGFSGYNGATLTNCYAAGESAAVSVAGGFYAGGLVGYDQYAKLTNCIAMGDVSAATETGTAAFVGGLLGQSAVAADLANCRRYAAQKCTIKIGASTSTAPTNTTGTVCSVLELNAAVFYTDTLTWSGSVWDFSDLDTAAGKYPTHK